MPTRPDGSVPEDPHEQVEWVFRNMFEVLEAADMGPENLDRMTSFITGKQYFDAYIEAKARMMGDHRPDLDSGHRLGPGRSGTGRRDRVPARKGDLNSGSKNPV